MKKIKILVLIFLVLSIVFCIYNFVFYLYTKDWISSNATITFVGLPDGAVIGTYTDINNITHTDVLLYIDYFHQGYSIDVDKLIGKEVRIIYNSKTGEIGKSNTISYLFSAVLLGVSTLLMFIFYKKKPCSQK